jgi:hypothetical protein
MIAKVVPRAACPGSGSASATRSAAAGLTAYLLGPGALDHSSAAGPGDAVHSSDTPGPCGSQHVEPRVVTGSASLRPAVLAARTTTVDWSDPAAAWAQLRTVAADAAHLLTTPLAGAAEPAAGRDLLWHTVLAAHPDDPALPDPAWQTIARHLMLETGLDPGPRDRAVPWLAVRHGPNRAGADHLHVVAVLLRPDGSPASRNDDWFAAQRTARWAEQTYRLLPGAGRTTASQPRRSTGRPASLGEVAAVRRTGPPPPHPGWDPRVWRWAVKVGMNRMWTATGRAAAAVRSALARAWDTDQLLDLVRDSGYSPSLLRDRSDGAVLGWSVVGPGPSGRPRAWRGRDLGADLSWPRIQAHLAALPRVDRTGFRDVGWPLVASLTDPAAGPDLLPWQRYWLRDALWQIAATSEPDRTGSWTDAADLYASVTVVRRPPAFSRRDYAALLTSGSHTVSHLHADFAGLALAASNPTPATVPEAPPPAEWLDAVATIRRIVAVQSVTGPVHLLVDAQSPQRAPKAVALPRS